MDRKHPAVVHGAPNAGTDRGSAQIASACPTFEPAAVQRNCTRKHQNRLPLLLAERTTPEPGRVLAEPGARLPFREASEVLDLFAPPIVPAERPHHHKCIRNRLAWVLFAKEPDVRQRNGIELGGWTERTCYS
jgi:hypothetical protein